MSIIRFRFDSLTWIMWCRRRALPCMYLLARFFFDLKQHGMSSKPLLRSDSALRSTEGSVFSLRIHPKQIFLLWAGAEKPARDWPHQIEHEAYQQPAFLYLLQVTTTHSYRDTSVGTVWSAVNTRRNVCIDGASDFRGRRHRLNRDGGDSSHFHDCSRWAWQTIVTSLAKPRPV
jgi:hypothetical protein